MIVGRSQRAFNALATRLQTFRIRFAYEIPRFDSKRAFIIPKTLRFDSSVGIGPNRRNAWANRAVRFDARIRLRCFASIESLGRFAITFACRLLAEWKQRDIPRASLMFRLNALTRFAIVESP